MEGDGDGTRSTSGLAVVLARSPRVGGYSGRPRCRRVRGYGLGGLVDRCLVGRMVRMRVRRPFAKGLTGDRYTKGCT